MKKNFKNKHKLTQVLFGSVICLIVFNGAHKNVFGFTSDNKNSLNNPPPFKAVPPVTPNAYEAPVVKPIYIWFEAEDAIKHTFPKSLAFKAYTAQEKAKLSAGDWLQTHKGQGVTAQWQVTVAQGGEYNFWTRKFWHHGPFKWKWNKGKWHTVTRACALEDSVELRKHLCANWVFLGKVKLPAGKNRLYMQALPQATAIAHDCWLLIQGDFVPNGGNKPGQAYERTEPGWFAWEPRPDKFAKKCRIDLRGMNQKRAGEDGFVKAQGNDFIFANTGQKVKFWAVNCDAHSSNKAVMRYTARRLAKLGVNMVRIHGKLFAEGADDPTVIDKVYLKRIHFFVHTLAQEGIYTKLSFYFPLWFKVKKSYGLSGYKAGAVPFAAIFFHPRMQTIYKSWAKKLLTTVNPYTGKSLADDPAVGIVEIINEDSYFFWTFNPQKIPKPIMRVLEKKFGKWLKQKYGSLAKAQATWGDQGLKPKSDRPAKGRMGLYAAGFLTSYDWAVEQRNQKRAQDTARFLAKEQRQFYKNMEKYFRQKLQVKCALTATNWTTSDNRILGSLDKWTNMVCGVLDRHAYWGGTHGSNDGRDSYAIGRNHWYQDATNLKTPASITKELQYKGHPHIVSEYNYPMPNRFRAEAPFMAAVYGCLNGTDGFFHFAMKPGEWQKSHTKFSIYTPVIMGQFPALAVMYRLGLVQEAQAVASYTASLEGLFALQGTPLSQSATLDKLRKNDLPPTDRSPSKGRQQLDPLAYFVGRVTMDIASAPSKSQVSDISAFINRRHKTVTSITKEIQWDWQKGIIKVNAAAAQGVCGFIGRHIIELDHLKVEFEVEYGTVIAVSMDGRPLSKSRKILLQVMTEDRNYGWQTKSLVKNKEKVKLITDLGAPPIIVKNIQGTVALKRKDAADMQVTALDHNGYQKKIIGNAAQINLLPDIIWYVITN